MGIRNYKDLVAWQKAMDLVEAVYSATQRFPKEEVYVLTSQIRRAAISVPSNIAEGQGRNSENDYRRFLSIAHGSLREVETQILIAERLQYVTSDEVPRLLALIDEVSRLLQGLQKAIKARPINQASSKRISAPVTPTDAEIYIDYIP